MKYRIKIITYRDGTITYFPQYKFFVFWFSFTKTNLFGDTIKVRTDSREDALEIIDNHYKNKLSQEPKEIRFEYINK